MIDPEHFDRPLFASHGGSLLSTNEKNELVFIKPPSFGCYRQGQSPPNNWLIQPLNKLANEYLSAYDEYEIEELTLTREELLTLFGLLHSTKEQQELSNILRRN